MKPFSQITINYPFISSWDRCHLINKITGSLILKSANPNNTF